MRHLALAALLALPAAAAVSATGIPLQALTEADVGADALKNSACYAHDGPAVLLVATKKNAIVNAEGDLLLLDRLDDDGFPRNGARYGSNTFKVVDLAGAGRSRRHDFGWADRPVGADQRAQEGKYVEHHARWSCNPSKSA